MIAGSQVAGGGWRTYLGTSALGLPARNSDDRGLDGVSSLHTGNTQRAHM